MRILKYKDYSNSEEALDVFLSNMNLIKESSIDDSFIKKTLLGLSSDLKFNIGLVFTFGTGIKVMYPIVDNLVKNGNLKIDPTPENIILLCLTALSICYLEDIKNNSGEEKVKCQNCKNGCGQCKDGFIDSKVTKKDAQTLLEELKMRGIGNGLVKKFVKVFQSIGNIIKMIFKNSPYSIRGLIEMFGYTSLMIPLMNGVSAVVGKYDLTPDTLIGNFLALGAGITTFIAKNGIDIIINKLRGKVNLKSNISDVPELIDTSNDISEKPINEQ